MNASNPVPPNPPPHPVRWLVLVTAAGTVMGLITLNRTLPARTPSAETVEIPVESIAETQSPSASAVSGTEGQAQTLNPGESGEPRPEDSLSAPGDREAISAAAHEKVARLASLMALMGKPDGDLPPETLEAWKSGLQDLAGMGASAIPAILQFLGRGTDVAFKSELRDDLGHNSARTGLLNVLRSIGGPEAAAAMSQVLNQTQSYHEVALLAQGLEESAPGEHRDQALAIARQHLAAANTGTVKPGTADLAPLFEVLGTYGTPETAQDLEAAAGRWKYYAMSALAKLPDGAGVPSLIRLAEPGSPGGNRLQALQVLTELAPGNEGAREFLIAQAGRGEIPPEYWSYLKQPLAGNQYFVADAVLTQFPPVSNWADLQTIHINSGNQTLYSIPSSASQTPEGIQRQLALIDQLAGSARIPAAQNTLQQARQTLELRLQRATAGQTPFTTENP